MYTSSYKRMDKKEFVERIDRLYSLMESCSLCPRRCRVDRKSVKGYCGGGWLPKVSSVGPHFGEELELVGRTGSGTIFFSGCNLKCVFCQNYQISCFEEGDEISPKELAKEMLLLQKIRCNNVNLVTPTHFAPQIVEAIFYAMEKGLEIPVVYNTGGYDSVEVLKVLEEIIDIYMPDIKYFNPQVAKKYSNAEDYPAVVKEVILEMYRQVDDLMVKNGIAYRGLLIRHLVMPGMVGDTKEILKFIAENLSLNTYVNVMAQYRPCYKAYEFPEIARRITPQEYGEALTFGKELGFVRI